MSLLLKHKQKLIFIHIRSVRSRMSSSPLVLSFGLFIRHLMRMTLLSSSWVAFKKIKHISAGSCRVSEEFFYLTNVCIRCSTRDSLSYSIRRNRLSCSVSCLDLFGEALVGEDLLLLEDFLSEADLKFDDGLFVNDAIFGPAIIQEELLIIDLNGLAPHNT